MKRIVLSICAALTVCLVAWCGGVDFNERGFDMAMVAMYALAAGFMAYTYPGGGK